MSKRIKEEEKIEKTIRALLKLPENRRCINCNLLGPQYVCTTFLTFVCTNCSGIHREFTHRVKSVSMAKFSTEEVSALEAGGNERARQIYLKDWDPQRHSYPDGSNLHRLRDFIKHVYVDRKYTGGRNNELPRLRLGEKEQIRESRKVGAYLGGSRSPRYESRSEQSSSGKSSSGRSDDRVRYYYDERRSPKYKQENSRIGGYRKSPVRFEVVDDRFRDDEFGRGSQSNSRHSTSREWKPGSRSPDCQKSMDRSSSLVVRPVKDILGENSPPLEVHKISEDANEKITDGTTNNQIESSGSSHSVDGNPSEDKNDRTLCLIDLNTVTDSSDAAPATNQTLQIVPSDNVSVNAKASPSPQPNTLEFLLFELSAPSVAPNTSERQSSHAAPSTESGCSTPGGSVSLAVAATQMPSPPPSSINASVSAPNMSLQASGMNVPAAGSPFELMLTQPGNIDASTAESINTSPVQPSLSTVAVPPASSSNEPVQPSGCHSPADTASQITSLGHMSTSAVSVVSPVSPLGQMSTSHNSNSVSPTMSTTVPKTPQYTTSGVETQPFPAEAAGGRKALPEDLFCERFLPTPAPLTRWQSGPPHAVGFSMQYYPSAMIVPAQANTLKSTNPFDLNNETAPMQVQPFPSMASLQGVLPNVGLLHTSDLGAHSPALMAPQSPSYASGVRPPSTFLSAVTHSPIMGQQTQANITPSRLQELGGVGSDKDAFSTLNPLQQPTSGYTVNSTANSFSSMGGNPFG